MITTNWIPSAWNQVFTDNAVAHAILDRLAERAEVFHLQGKSYRETDRRRRRGLADAAVPERLRTRLSCPPRCSSSWGRGQLPGAETWLLPMGRFHAWRTAWGTAPSAQSVRPLGALLYERNLLSSQRGPLIAMLVCGLFMNFPG